MEIAEIEIKNITDFGIFVGLTQELDGLIHASDVSWEDSSSKAIEKYKIGEKVKFKTDIDVEKERFLWVLNNTKSSIKEDKFVNKTKHALLKN